MKIPNQILVWGKMQLGCFVRIESSGNMRVAAGVCGVFGTAVLLWLERFGAMMAAAADWRVGTRIIRSML